VQLALATIEQAYTGVSDDEVIEATLMDRRWQLVLDCLDIEQAPFSKGTLVAFRKRFIAAQVDRRLIERTIEIVSQSQDFGPREGCVQPWITVHHVQVADQQGRELADLGQVAGQKWCVERSGYKSRPCCRYHACECAGSERHQRDWR
jgi:hypothetical protein